MSVDFDKPVFISGSEKAKWGLDLLFKQKLNCSVEPLPEFSNHRIQVVKLSLEVPIIIVNVYLPSSSLPESEYDDSLSLLSTILTTYTPEAAILLAGDWNSSLYRSSARDRKFQTFCQTAGLITATRTDNKPSYHGYNGSTSKIDYVFAHRDSCLMHGVNVDDVRIIGQICKEEDATIISTHDPIVFEVRYITGDLSKQEQSVEHEAVEIVQKQIDWDKADITDYQNYLENLLSQIFEFWKSPENLQILSAVIPSSFIQAAELSAPSKSSKKPNYKVFKSEEWLKAEKVAKKSSRAWMKAGKPRDDDNNLFKAKKESNINLRKAIKLNNIQANTDENNKMMNANFKDPKLFSKLVNKKRSCNSGYTAMIKIEDSVYKGDAQVLSGFFKYHNDRSSPPEVFKSENNHTYFYSTIDVEAISFIIKQRKWKLPRLNFNQVQNLINRLKVNKSPDYFGFSAKHIKHGGVVAVKYIMEYLNMSFSNIEYGVPEQELVGTGSLVHKGGKKSLCDPKNFRKITVCALLGQLKQMAVCDITLPILKPLKPNSQMGFTPGLFVKMANIMVTEKRAWAVAHDRILLIQFLDATAAFDKTLHPIILSHLYNDGVIDDQWKYFQLLHQNAATHIKWNGNISKDVIKETIGNRQGGYSSADEWKLYGNKMLLNLEEQCTNLDIMAGAETNVIAIADDVAPCATGDDPRDALHKMQLLLNVVEDQGTQHHMEFGTDKCKLLIAARPGKLKAVETILNNEPGVLTFYGHPVKQVDEPYIHIGVPQSPRNQSSSSVEYRITKGQNMYYKLQDSTKNSICGVSPLSNRKMFLSYHQPSYIYGLDTMHVNKTDMAKMEIKYRKVLKNMMALPECVASPLVYLSIGVLPATAQRDLEILGLLGQLAMCDDSNQYVRKIMAHNLAFFDDKFAGWSGLVRRTTQEYGLPDPLQYLDNPWRPDRWRSHCRQVISGKWDRTLREEAAPKISCQFVDLDSMTTSTPMRIWQQAGLNSAASTEATVVSWMYCGVYFTREFMFEMKKVKSPKCACDNETSENLSHFILHCQLYETIRNQYIPKYVEMNRNIMQLIDDEKMLLISIFDPLSTKLPNTITRNWSSVTGVYNLSRKFCYRMHKKREKVYEELDK